MYTYICTLCVAYLIGVCMPEPKRSVLDQRQRCLGRHMADLILIICCFVVFRRRRPPNSRSKLQSVVCHDGFAFVLSTQLAHRAGIFHDLTCLGQAILFSRQGTSTYTAHKVIICMLEWQWPVHTTLLVGAHTR